MTANILVVDDNRDNLRLLHDLLTEQGYIVRPVALGIRAITAAQSKLPDLILLDIMMPEMDGYAVCDALKADDRTRHVPVIFISALNETIDQVKAFSSGGVDFITKPFQPEELFARVKTHLELKRAREAIEEQKRQLQAQNLELVEAARLREDVERITRHDLKTPLSAIIGYPQRLLLNENLTSVGREHLKAIEAAGYQMLRMINSSLDLFKMERGTYQFQPVPVNIVEILTRIATELHLLIQQQGVTLDVFFNGHPACDEDICSIPGEELLCYSMLANLIKNAIEASPEGDRVTVCLDHDDEAEVIRIHNTGIVAEEICDRFFEKYVTSRKNSGGTGLGTYSAKLMAETQHGVISMTSSAQGGTTITLCFPSGIFAHDEHVQCATRPVPGAEHLIPPSQDELTTLYKLAEMGDIGGIEEYVKHLKIQNPTYAPFAAMILQLRETFQISRIQECIREFME